MPVCVPIDRPRPRTPAELSAFHYMQTKKSSTPLAADAQTQQGFVDERASLVIPTVADPSRPADDEQDSEMSELTQMTSAERRKVDETAKELRASLPVTASSHVSSLRRDDETQEQFTSSVKQARSTKRGVETLQDVSFSVSKKGICEYQRNGFLQVRMDGVRQSNKKKLLKKKDGERNLHFASCPAESASCSQRDETCPMEKVAQFQCTCYSDR